MLNKEQYYEQLYMVWKDAIGKKSHFSKSTAYVDNEEFRAIVSVGDEIVPFLVKKLINNKDQDFFLEDAIVDIMKLSLNESAETDYGIKRNVVLDILESKAEKGTD
jgi:hypothetical protein